MKIVFLSSLFPKSLVNEIEQNSKGNIHYAGNTLQWNFLLGFAQNNPEVIDVINAPLIGSFPAFYKKLFIPSSRFDLNENAYGISIKYCNLAIIKNIFITFGLKRELKALINREGNRMITIIVYGMHAPYMKAAEYAKRINPSIKICLIVPDLPKYYGNNNGIVWKIRASTLCAATLK